MKKQLVFVAGLAVLATPAFASKARLQALGESSNGSFYVQDNRNIFLNASEVLNHKDLVTYEAGAAGATDEDGAPNAEGGVYRAMGNMVYGVQFGRTLDYNTKSTAVGKKAGATSVYNAPNALDVFVGGDAGIKWGAQLTYASGKDDAFNADASAATDKAKADVIDLAVGVGQGQWSAYAKYGVTGKTKIDELSSKITRKTPFELGASYKMDVYTVFAQYASSKYEVKTTSTDDAKYSNYQVGVGRQDKLNDKATLFTKLAYTASTDDLKDVGGSKTETKALPAVIGLEYDAASWLAVRGSITQNIVIGEQKVGSNKSTLSSTAVNTGASLKFGDLTIDGLVGTSGTNGDNNGAKKNGVLNTDNLLTRFSATYRF